MDFKFDWIIVRDQVPAAGTTPTEVRSSPIPNDVQLTGLGSRNPNETVTKTARPDFATSRVQLTENEAEEVATEKSVQSVAPMMPVSLIQTVSRDEQESQSGGSWAFPIDDGDKQGPDGKGVKVAVLDSGIDETHAAFEGIDLTCHNFTDEDPGDTDGHGTHCAGTIFGRDVDGQRIGVARGVTEALIGKIIGENGGSTQSIVDAMAWAMGLGARVISMSVGLDFVGFQQRLIAQGIQPRKATALTLEGFRRNILMFDKLTRAFGGQEGLVNGPVVVAAAGNSSDAPNFRIDAEVPSNSEGFVSVAALDHAGNLAEFSNIGAKLAAPGVDILSARAGGGLAEMTGTSMATPYVAGIACLYAELLEDQGIQANSSDILRELKDNATPLQPKIPTSHVAWGRAEIPQTGTGE